MRLLVLDPHAENRELVVSRVKEAIRQTGLRRTEVVDGTFELLNPQNHGPAPLLVFLGPSAFDNLEQSIEHVRAVFPLAPIGLVLDNQTYALEAIRLRKSVNVRIMPVADIAQMAHFILDSEQLSGADGPEGNGICMVTQLKGGVGASTIAAGLGACWARNGLSVALVDFDDVNPQLTDWGRVGASQRKIVGELLRGGRVPAYRISEVTTLVEGYDGQLAVVGQPEHYQEGFHFKADVLEGAPSAALFVDSLLRELRERFDIVIIDAGRSWGIATFAALPLCQHVLLVTDDDGMSLRRSLDNLRRFYRESDDPLEFSFKRWSVILNGHTGRILSPTEVSDEIENQGIFPEEATLFTVPFSERGRQWGGPGESFYELAEPGVKSVLSDIAFGLIPFRKDEPAVNFGGLKRRVQQLIGLAS